MNTSFDKILGTGQTRPSFWKKVQQGYDAAQLANPQQIRPRNTNALKGTWNRISEGVGKWVGCYAKADGRRRSGQSEDDVYKEAASMFQASYGKFQYYDEWLLMKKWPKYDTVVGDGAVKVQKGRPSGSSAMANSTGSSGKRTRDDEGGSTPDTPTSAAVWDDAMPRPEGVKKAKSRLKEKGKAVPTEAVEELGTFNERLSLFNITWEKSHAQKEEKMRLLKEKEERKKKQVQLDTFKMKWEMVQSLLAKEKETRTSWEEQMLAEGIEYVTNNMI
ncbi:Glutathione S-transferase T2 [Bienertia sinuspersici]